MNKTFRSLALLAVVVALPGAALAQTAPKTPKTAKTAMATPAKKTVITASGTLSKFDAASNMLTLKNSSGEYEIMLPSTASIMAGGKKISASDLSNETGHKVTVHYTQNAGQKTAESVVVSSAAPKTASAKKAATGKKS